MKFTVIMPTIRNDKFAKIAKASVENQTYGDAQILYSSKRPTAGVAINDCLDKAEGELITFCFDDDVLMLEKHEILAMYADKYPDIDVFYTGFVTINDKSKILSIWSPPVFNSKVFEFGNLISLLTCAIRRKAIGDTRFRLDYPICDEFVFFYNLFQKGCKFMCINVPLVLQRQWKDQNTHKKHEAKLKEHERIAKEYGEHLYSKRKYTEYFENVEKTTTTS